MNRNTRRRNNDQIIQFGLFACVCGLFTAGVVLDFNKGAGAAATAFSVAVFCLIFVFLSRFRRFKGFGIEAELWEQKQEEAAKLVDTLRALAVVVSEQLIGLNSRMGRWGTGTLRKDLFDLVDRLEGILGEVNVSTQETDRMKQDFYRYTAVDMALPIKNKIDAAIERKLTERRDLINKEFGSPIKNVEGYKKAADRLSQIAKQKVDWDRIIRLRPDAEMFEAFERTVAVADCLSEGERSELQSSIAEEMADLHEWLTARRLRRPKEWLDHEPE